MIEKDKNPTTTSHCLMIYLLTALKKILRKSDDRIEAFLSKSLNSFKSPKAFNHIQTFRGITKALTYFLGEAEDIIGNRPANHVRYI
ncbi:hypothetical protein AC249_AIPGENE4109 [Exaiptasia diaphana]|nr:hypothetical protein AC249_AIPGENE4109 [Exaiptasia diaphana]